MGNRYDRTPPFKLDPPALGMGHGRKPSELRKPCVLYWVSRCMQMSTKKSTAVLSVRLGWEVEREKRGCYLGWVDLDLDVNEGNGYLSAMQIQTLTLRVLPFKRGKT